MVAFSRCRPRRVEQGPLGQKQACGEASALCANCTGRGQATRCMRGVPHGPDSSWRSTRILPRRGSSRTMAST